MKIQNPVVPYLQQSNRNSYSQDGFRLGSKSPVNQQLQQQQQQQQQQQSRIGTPKSQLIDKQNIQSLQSIKDQITALQSNLKNQKPQLSSIKQQNSKTEKSFFSLIKEQLKQVSKISQQANPQNNQEPQIQLQLPVYFAPSKIQRRSSQKSNQLIVQSSSFLSNPQYNKNELLQVQSQLFHGSSTPIPSSDVQIISKQRDHHKMSSSMLGFNLIEKEERDYLQQKLIQIDEKKVKMLKKLKQKYKEEKIKIIEHYEKEYKIEKENYSHKLKTRLLEIQKAAKQQKNQQALQDNRYNPRAMRASSGKIKASVMNFQEISSPSSQSSSSYSDDNLNNIKKKIQNQDDDYSSDEEIVQEKVHLVSSLKKENSKNIQQQQQQQLEQQKKKQRVRFKNYPINDKIPNHENPTINTNKNNNKDNNKDKDKDRDRDRDRERGRDWNNQNTRLSTSPHTLSRYKTEQELSFEMDQKLHAMLLKYY